MNRTVLDLWVGFFVALGLAALLFLSLKVGNLSSSNLSESYVLKAKFDNIGGLKVRGPVKSAGVVIGRIVDIHFDSATYEAVVSMTIDGRYRFPKDTFASINTAGLLGEQYPRHRPAGRAEPDQPERCGAGAPGQALHRSTRRACSASNTSVSMQGGMKRCCRPVIRLPRRNQQLCSKN